MLPVGNVTKLGYTEVTTCGIVTYVGYWGIRS